MAVLHRTPPSACDGYPAAAGPHSRPAPVAGVLSRSHLRIGRALLVLGALAGVGMMAVPARAQSPAPPARVTVQLGDTLSGLAVRYYGSAGAASTIAAANGFTNPDRILAGTLLTLPASAAATGTTSGSASVARGPSRKTTVAPGETLSAIAERVYGSAAVASSLAAANRLTNADWIYAGMELELPAGLTPPVTAPTIASRSGGRRVCLDPGHGGNDPGASFVFEGGRVLRESDVSLDMALALAARLRAQGLAVTLTRQDDTTVDLSERAVRCNLAGAGLAISIHLNGVDDRTVNGSLALWGKASDRGVAELMAGLLQNGLFGPRRDDVTAFGARPFAGRVLLYTAMPAVLVEPVFLTNPAEARLLLSATADPGSRRAQIVRAVERGVLGYIR